MTVPLERGLPVAIDAERFTIGWLMDADTNEALLRAREVLKPADFALERHQAIYQTLCDLDTAGTRTDRVHVAEHLMRTNKLESVGGLTALIELTEGIPRVPDISGYLRLIREKAALRHVIAICQATMNRCLLEEQESADLISLATKQLAGLAIDPEDGRRWVTAGSVVEEAPGGLQPFITPPAGSGGIPLPWPMVDQVCGGLQKGQLIILAARPGVGKSSAALQIAWHAVKCGHAPALISLEVKKESITRRLLSQISYVDSQKMRAGLMNPDERAKLSKAARELGPEPFWINDTRNQTAESIRLSLKKHRDEAPIDIILVDHFHLVKGGSSREEERIRYNRIADSFQDLGGEFDCPVVVLAQLSRKCEEDNRLPGLTDLKETGKLEENADVVMMIHRPETYAKNRGREEYKGVAQFLLPKQRDGATGAINMVWLAGCQRFESRAEDMD